jgi:phospholipid/cholesterol/gamma-HCH transport system substrate-binding protein
MDMEVVIGSLLLLGAIGLVYFSIRLGQIDVFGSWGYDLQADFSTVGGLQTGAVIQLAGVEIGRVEAVDLVDYRARVTMKVRHEVHLPKDSKAAVKSTGLIGERHIEIIPGKDNAQIPPGGQIQHTESPVDIPELIAQFIHGNVTDSGQDDRASGAGNLDLD